ncbi:hypothetical protein B0H14DRAFT_2849248 [Mycena olivaceomarginata]|nr:hypothetical protein B0H14DRAFT_2849248 [Mycena olivaceomarginata]
MASQIPSFYRIWFTIVDPILSVFGALGALLVPGTVLNGYTPHAVSPPAPETIMLLDTLSGFFFALIFIQVVLLRARPADIGIWRILIFSILLADIVILGGLARLLRGESRAHPAAWRKEEWMNIVPTAGVTVIRIAFCLGVGMGPRVKKE